ncbi:30S ribosomal protein S1 [Candidatus Hodgkinia cicadicola]|nr:30S ribosomal protein S1 [Candidatus Hodgkinia cicadicola]
MSHVCKAINKVIKRETTRRLLTNELVTGSVTHKNEMFMTVNIGYKRDAKLRNSSVWNYDSYEANSNIRVYIEQIESQTNETILSRRSLDSDKAWKALAKAKSQDSATEGLIEAKTDDGYVVKVLGLTALLPFSLIAESLRDRKLTGLKLKLKVLQLNKSENFIELSLAESEEEKTAHRMECDNEEVWGALKEASETGVVLDLGERVGHLWLQNVQWHVAVELITGAGLGQLIGSQSEETSSNNTKLTLLDVPALGPKKQQVPIFGLIAAATRQALTIQTTTDTYGVASAKQFDVYSVSEHLEDHELEIGDVVKTLPIKIDYAGKQTAIDIDIESARHHKYATLNEKNTVIGFVAESNNNTVTIALGDGVQGLIEVDTSEQATAACELLKDTLLELDVIDYDPDLNIISLQTVLDERTTACLVEA